MKSLEIDMVEDGDPTYGLTNAGDTIVNEDGPIGAAAALEADIVNEDIDPDDKLPDHARPNVDGSVTLPLKHPRTIRSQKGGKITETIYAELVLHRLTGADLNAIGATSGETQNVVMVSRSTRISHAIMAALYAKLDAADAIYALQVINHFLPSGPKTRK